MYATFIEFESYDADGSGVVVIWGAVAFLLSLYSIKYSGGAVYS